LKAYMIARQLFVSNWVNTGNGYCQTIDSPVSIEYDFELKLLMLNSFQKRLR